MFTKVLVNNSTHFHTSGGRKNTKIFIQMFAYALKEEEEGEKSVTSSAREKGGSPFFIIYNSYYIPAGVSDN